jgi:uncharacterized membrane protein
VSDSLDHRLDAFELRLHELEDELGQLRRLASAQVLTAAPAPDPQQQAEPAVLRAPAAPLEPQPALAPWFVTVLEDVKALIDAGDVKHALRMLEGARATALSRGDMAVLSAIVDLARSIGASTSSSTRGRAERLVYSATQNLRFLGQKTDPAATAQSSVPTWTAPIAASHPETVSRPATKRPKVTAESLLGASTLAIAGGVVTLLGIVFFFVLAVNRGWIGPIGRVGLGAAASALVFAAGFELRRRYGDTRASLAAAGVGISGGFVTLLAAAAMYDLVSTYAALAICSAIATIGLATSLLWKSQTVAGFGLVGAMLVPVVVAAQSGLSVLGTAFVSILFATAAVVSLRRDWWKLLAVSGLVTAPQIAALVARPEYHGAAPWRIVTLAIVFSALYAATGIVYQLQRSGDGLGQLSTSFLSGSATLAALGAVRLFGDQHDKGIALALIAVAYLALSAVVFRRATARDVSAFLAAIGLTVGAVAVAVLFDGNAVTYAWAAEGALLAWLARRVRELRYQVWSAIYVLLALGHALVLDAPPVQLLRDVVQPAAGVSSVIAAAAACTVFGLYARPWSERFADRGGLYGWLAPLFTAWQDVQGVMRSIAFWAAGALGAYAASLGALAFSTSFDWGHVAVATIFAGTGLGLMLVGSSRRSAQLRDGGLAWLGLTTVFVVVHGQLTIEATPRAWSFAVVGVALLAAGLARQLLRRRPVTLDLAAAILAVIAAGLLGAAVHLLVGNGADATTGEGLGLLGLGIVYAVLAVAVRLRAERDFASVLGSVALVAGIIGSAELFDGTALVLVWVVGSALLGWLARNVRERRLLVAAGVLAALAVAHAFAFDAPPNRLFTTGEHPAGGALAVLATAIGVGWLAYLLVGDESWLPKLRLAGWCTAGVLGVYGLSLVILDAVERMFPGVSLHTSFQRGQTGVSAFWGLIGLALLYAGLKRWRGLRIAGFAVLGVSLAKIFLYDLPSLSSVTRAASFLAVGAVLLLGGFLYQHLSADGGHDSNGPRSV